MRKRHTAGKILLSLCLAAAICAGGFLLWASDCYHADDIAIAVMADGGNITSEDGMAVISPSYSTDTALIFYPGAKVEAAAYLPILEKIVQQCGITCILVEMPLNLAIFDADAADRAVGAFPDIERWYIGGHSMGGAMAGSYAAKHQDKIDGLILLGAYIYGDYPPEKSITIYGSFNDNLEKNIDYTENIVVIEGGNHAQFGNYGKQKGDRDATITSEEQQNIAVGAIADFLAGA